MLLLASPCYSRLLGRHGLLLGFTHASEHNNKIIARIIIILLLASPCYSRLLGRHGLLLGFTHASEHNNKIIARISIILLLTSPCYSRLLGWRPNCSQDGWVAGWPER